MKNRIREHRNARKLTLEQLAEMVGTSKGYLSDIETGKAEPTDHQCPSRDFRPERTFPLTERFAACELILMAQRDT